MASAEEKGGRLVKLSGAVTKTIAFQTAWGESRQDIAKRCKWSFQREKSR